MFQFVSKSRTWIWRKLQKKCQNLFRKIQNRKNSIFRQKSDIFYSDKFDFFNEIGRFGQK